MARWDPESVSLCETLDRVLNKGVVVGGEIVISVAEIDLLYLGVQLMLTSVETASQLKLTLRPPAWAGSSPSIV
ncbi:MAG: gas vesicle protein [Acidobacteria bacterium]|nr:gas vesicle protein [Acidobacteriota bacterium]